MKVLAALVLLAHPALFAADAAFQKHAIATVHPLATEAGQQAFEKGGNAMDAAIAAGLTLGVVDGHNSGIGGGCFFVIHAADGTVTCIDGREMAPAKAQRDMYVIDGKLDDEASKTGALASGVPGYLKACAAAQTKHGKLKLADVLLPAAEIAEKNNITKKQAVEILEFIAETAYKNAKNSFTIPGLGKLVLVNRAARIGRNPATGEQIKIKAKRVVKFRVAKAAKDAILGVKK